MMVDLEASAAFFWSQQAEMDRDPPNTWLNLGRIGREPGVVAKAIYSSIF